MKLQIFEIRKGDLKKDAVKNKWTDHAVATIKQIASVWLDSDIAQSVLLFFKEDITGDLHSYMPIIMDNQKDYLKVEQLKGAKKEDVIIGVEPYSTSDGVLSKEDTSIIVRIMKKIIGMGMRCLE